MKLAETVTTAALIVGSIVFTSGTEQTVTALFDTGRPAVFGSGTEWSVSLQSDRFGAREMAAPASHKWNLVG